MGRRFKTTAELEFVFEDETYTIKFKDRTSEEFLECFAEWSGGQMFYLGYPDDSVEVRMQAGAMRIRQHCEIFDRLALSMDFDPVDPENWLAEVPPIIKTTAVMRLFDTERVTEIDKKK